MFNLVYNSNSLFDSFILSQRQSSWKCSSQKYEYNLLRNVFKTKSELETGAYQQKAFYEFDLNERGKHRHIKSLHISDRVIQRSFCDNSLVPIVKNKLAYDNGASVKHKGISFARRRLAIHLRKYFNKFGSEGYILQIDFKKFFDSIPHDKLKQIFKSLLDEKEYKLFCSLIETFNDGDNKSIGIGSQISQICGVFYSTVIDNYFKIVKGCKYYGRYMDDTYIIHHNKEYLKSLLSDYIALANRYGLTVNLKKTHIVKLSHGFTFLKIKYNLLADGTILKRLPREVVVRERRKLKKYRKLIDEKRLSLDVVFNAYKSWRGTYKKFNSHNTIRQMDKLFNSLFGGIYERRKKTRNFDKNQLS